jgi:hypothetical protein
MWRKRLLSDRRRLLRFRDDFWEVSAEEQYYGDASFLVFFPQRFLSADLPVSFL